MNFIKIIQKTNFGAMAIFVSGCLLDHFTTAYGISIPGLTESNSFVLMLMNYGLWHLAEIVVIVFGIGASLMSTRNDKAILTTFSTLMLISGGLLRLAVGFQNLSLIL